MKILAAAGCLTFFLYFKLAHMKKPIDLQFVIRFERSESVTYVTWHNE